MYPNDLTLNFQTNSMRLLYKWPVVVALLLVATTIAAQDSTQQIVPNRLNSAAQQTKPYVILISADGFRHDLAEKYNATNLLRLRASGVTAKYLQPSYPSLTFPNHYTIVTGLYPSHHGLVDNSFFDEGGKGLYTMSNKKAVADGSWYGGTPLWVLAEQQQMLSASFFWVASEADIQQTRPTYYYVYNEKIHIDTRIRTIKEWLQLPEDRRPHFITFYLSDVDHEEHTHGPDSKETEEAVHFIDNTVGRLVATIDSLHLPVNYIFLSDHGMTKVDIKQPIRMPAAIDTAKFYVPWGTSLLHLYAKDRSAIASTYKALKKEAVDYDVYLATKTPRRWHYRKKDDRFNRIGDIILVPRLPKVFSLGTRVPSLGQHGFDPALKDMHASFYAWGPAFKENIIIDGFENIHVFPLIASILGLSYSFDIDGKLRVLQPVLK
jgi:predicted AlkP superfamily pyrophosphatase or phosphodiesterase